MNRYFSLLTAVAAAIVAGCGQDPAHRIVGQLESDRIEITAEFAEPIVARHVQEGDPVTAGQLLLQLDTERIEARIAAATAALEERNARLAELIRGPRSEKIAAARANLEGAKHDLELRMLEYDREQKLLQQNLTSPASRDRARAALDAARAAVEFNEAQLAELLTGTTLEELTQAEQAVRQAEAQYAALDIDRQRHSLRAPNDAIVDSILYEPGERPAVGTPVLVLLGGEQPYARVYIPEQMRASIAPGTPAIVYVDGIAEPLDARVRWASSDTAFTPYFALTEHDRGRLTYVAKIDFAGVERRLPDGVPVEVEFPSASGTAPR
ncbi:MAG: HlyD family efflux transporter periplasmic adaptor subunit [Gammaproteobacteria bacterium]|nr:HlyD family efflux transporter periplasmic adaptor subunit [Gammaproteobacteria bacterium]